MGRYLPPTYDPIPDAAIANGANLTDLVRRIARNQNWIWANQGNVLAAWGAEPTSAIIARFTAPGDSELARFACPNRSTTGSEYLTVSATLTVSSGVANARLALFQLLPGQSALDNNSPRSYSGPIHGGDPNQLVQFDARVVVSQSPVRFVLRLEVMAGNAAQIQVVSAAVHWKSSAYSLRGETIESQWRPISSALLGTGNRPVSSALLRRIQNSGTWLLTQNPTPIWSHSFVYPWMDSNVPQTTYGLSRHIVRLGPITRPFTVTATVRVTGQGAVGRITAKCLIPGGGSTLSSQYSGNTAPTGPSTGIWSSISTLAVSVPAPGGNWGFYEVQIDGTVSTAGGANAYGMEILGVSIRLDPPPAPPSPYFSATYQPLDDAACAADRPIVGALDRFGARAGVLPLVQNLQWLSQNRSALTLAADWMHRTQSAGYTGAGDAVWRNATLPVTSDRYNGHEQLTTQVPFATAQPPTDSREIANGGQHYPGSELAVFPSMPVTGAAVRFLARAERVEMAAPNGPPPDNTLVVLLGQGAGTVSVSAEDAAQAEGWAMSGVSLAPTPAGSPIYVQGLTTKRGYGNYSNGSVQVALHSLFAWEESLGQTDLDALT